MAIYFGTDGIRGITNDFLTCELANKCGNALAVYAREKIIDKREKEQILNIKITNKTTKIRNQLFKNLKKNSPNILIGGDTRVSREYLTCAFSSGAMSAGANIVDVGVCPTAGIAYLTKLFKFDYGVVISASHNPHDYNGIKIFNKNGFKLDDTQEELLERKFINQLNLNTDKIGKYIQCFYLTKFYTDYLMSCCNLSLNGLTILLDCANGASYKIAPTVFKKLGAKVISVSSRNCGNKINNNCGSTCPNQISKLVKKYKPDMAFAFDGDADRIIACDESGKILDGDQIIFILAKHLKDKGVLLKNQVVGTTHTNMGIEKDLNKFGINLIRTDIGDKYVICKMEEQKLSLGGEKSGHIILRDFSTTGDGILAGIMLAQIVKTNSQKLSQIAKVNLYPQINIDCVVKDKIKVINSERLFEQIKIQQQILGTDSRVMVRYSGTEPKIRIMVESFNKNQAEISAKEIEKTVIEIDKNYSCFEE